MRWKPASTAPLDERVILGNGGQIWYGATWIHAPAATELEFEFRSHPMTSMRWTLNGESAPLNAADFKDAKTKDRPMAVRTLTLRAGWNEVRFRGYCTGYPPFRAGLVLKAPAEKLWPLKLSATPP